MRRFLMRLSSKLQGISFEQSLPVLRGLSDAIFKTLDELGKEPKPAYEWKTYDVSGYPEHTIGYSNGNRMHLNLEIKLKELQASDEEVFSVNVVSYTTAYIVTRKEIV